MTRNCQMPCVYGTKRTEIIIGAKMHSPSSRLINFDCLKVPIYRVFIAAKQTANRRYIFVCITYEYVSSTFALLTSKFVRLKRPTQKWKCCHEMLYLIRCSVPAAVLPRRCSNNISLRWPLSSASSARMQLFVLRIPFF